MVPHRTERIQSPSLYIGGGTPTTMLDQLGPMLDGFHKVFDITGEVALETTVGDITSDTVARLRAIGISVLSLGVQSFDDRLLRTIGRTYGGDAAHEAVVTAQAGGFQSLNIDLMFCLPGQTVQDVLLDLKRAVATGSRPGDLLSPVLVPLFDCRQCAGPAGAAPATSSRATRHVSCDLCVPSRPTATSACRSGGSRRAWSSLFVGDTGRVPWLRGKRRVAHPGVVLVQHVLGVSSTWRRAPQAVRRWPCPCCSRPPWNGRCGSTGGYTRQA